MPLYTGKPAPVILTPRSEVDDVVLLGQFPVGQGVFGQFGFHAAHLYHEVVFGGSAFGHFVVRHIGDGVEQLLHIVCSLVHIGLQGFVGFFQLGHAALGCFGFVFLAFLHQHSDGFGEGIYLGKVVIE